MNPPFPKRNGQPAQQPARITHDPQNQVLCDACGCEDLQPRIHVFRTPGQVIGTVDITMDQLLICERCSAPVNMATNKLRREIAKFESKPA